MAHYIQIVLSGALQGLISVIQANPQLASGGAAAAEPAGNGAAPMDVDTEAKIAAGGAGMTSRVVDLLSCILTPMHHFLLLFISIAVLFRQHQEHQDSVLRARVRHHW